jgi:proton glutamate symport protein
LLRIKQTSFMKKNRVGLITFLFITIASLLGVLKDFNIADIPDNVMMATRWILAIQLVIFALFRKNLTTWILVCMVLGVFVGIDYPHVAVALQPLSKGFIKLVKTIVGPILFATLVYGIAGHSDLKQVGRMAWKSMLYFYCATTIALFIGLAAINITHAGVGVNIQNMPHNELPKPVKDPIDESILSTLPDSVHWLYKTLAFFRNIFPENIVKSVYDAQILQIVIFSVIFGIGLAMVDEKKRKPMVDFCESLSETMFKFTNIIMYFAQLEWVQLWHTR